MAFKADTFVRLLKQAWEGTLHPDLQNVESFCYDPDYGIMIWSQSGEVVVNLHFPKNSYRLFDQHGTIRVGGKYKTFFNVNFQNLNKKQWDVVKLCLSIEGY